jgi:hypothetical protein
VHGVSRENDAAQPEIADHLLGGGVRAERAPPALVALLVDFGVRQARAKASSPAMAEAEAKAVMVCAAFLSLM